VTAVNHTKGILVLKDTEQSLQKKGKSPSLHFVGP